jgi:transcriptional regulator with XRE-family HTH domain
VPISAQPSLEADAATELGRQFARRRVERGLSQQALANLVGISKGQLQVIERGWSDRVKQTPVNPRLGTLVGLCRELNARMTIDVSTPLGVVIEFDAIADS